MIVYLSYVTRIQTLYNRPGVGAVRPIVSPYRSPEFGVDEGGGSIVDGNFGNEDLISHRRQWVEFYSNLYKGCTTCPTHYSVKSHRRPTLSQYPCAICGNLPVEFCSTLYKEYATWLTNQVDPVGPVVIILSIRSEVRGFKPRRGP